MTHLTMGPIGTTLGWLRPSNTSTAKPFPWYLFATANRTVNVLVLWGVQIKNSHNFHKTWITVSLWWKNIKSGRKTANIKRGLQKNLRSFITVKAHGS